MKEGKATAFPSFASVECRSEADSRLLRCFYPTADNSGCVESTAPIEQTQNSNTGGRDATQERSTARASGDYGSEGWGVSLCDMGEFSRSGCETP